MAEKTSIKQEWWNFWHKQRNLIEEDISFFEKTWIDPVKLQQVINLQDEEGFNGLMYSIVYENPTLLKHLLTHSPDLNKQTKTGNTAFMWAMAKGKVCFDILFNYCQNQLEFPQFSSLLNAKNVKGDSALMFGCVSGYSELIQKILPFALDINAQNMDGNTALMIASKNGFHEIVDLLLKFGANPTMRNIKGQSPLDQAKNTECKTLIELKLKELKDQADSLSQALIDEERSHFASSHKQKKPKSIQKTNSSSKKKENIPKKVPNSANKKSLKISNVQIETPTIIEEANSDSHQEEWIKVNSKKTSLNKKENPIVTTTKSQESNQVSQSINELIKPNEATISEEIVKKEPVIEYSLDELNSNLYSLHPQAQVLDLKLSNFLGLKLNELSMGQLTALEDIHFQCLKLIQMEKLEKVKQQQQIQYEEQKVIELEISSISSKTQKTKKK